MLFKTKTQDKITFYFIQSISSLFTKLRVLLPNSLQIMLKKDGMIVVKFEKNENIPTKIVIGWIMCIYYRRLNKTTKKISFIDQILDRLRGDSYYYRLDSFLRLSLLLRIVRRLCLCACMGHLSQDDIQSFQCTNNVLEMHDGQSNNYPTSIRCERN